MQYSFSFDIHTNHTKTFINSIYKLHITVLSVYHLKKRTFFSSNSIKDISNADLYK